MKCFLITYPKLYKIWLYAIKIQFSYKNAVTANIVEIKGFSGILLEGSIIQVISVILV